MASSRDRILIVESDPVISDLIGRQALQASGYQVQVVNEANSAIGKALQWSPDLIITNLNLPGLSGKDLMVALTSQGVKTPIIILAQRGMEADIIQAFRVGASDYLLLPVREAEVISAVERALRQVQERRERDRLASQLQQTNQELQARVRELTTIFAVGKAVTSVTDQAALLDKILDGALRVTQAEIGWFLMRDEGDQPFRLVAERGLPSSLGIRLQQTWDDGISSLVAMSGEPLSIHGEPIKRFKISVLGGAALIVPIKVQQKRVVGLLVMMRRQAMAFTNSEQHLLEALADYAAISLVNARLFKTVEERARSLQHMAEAALLGDKINIDILEAAKRELASATNASLNSLDKLGRDPTARWRPDQRQLLTTIQEQLMIMKLVTGAIAPQQLHQPRKEKTLTPLNELARQSIQKNQPYAQQCSMNLSVELLPETLVSTLEASVMSQVLDGLISSAIRFSSQGANITVRVDRDHEFGRISIRTTALSTPLNDFEKIFDTPGHTAPLAGRFSGITIRPFLVKEIVTAERGKIWFENPTGKETVLHCALPLAR